VYCERYRCKLSREACLKRQKLARRANARRPGWQRGGSAAVLLSGSHCVDCEQGMKIAAEEKKMKSPTLKICNECGVEKPLSEYDRSKNCKDGHFGFCKSCRRKKVRQRTLAKKRGGSVKKAAGDTILTVDFSRHPHLMEHLQRQAAEAFRTIENQVRYLIYRESKREEAENRTSPGGN